jgi:hypothetical protein
MRPFSPRYYIYATNDRDSDWPEKMRLGPAQSGPCWVPPLGSLFAMCLGPLPGNFTSSIGPISLSPAGRTPDQLSFLAWIAVCGTPKTRYIAFSCSWSGLLHDDARKCPEPEEPIANRRWHRSVVPLLFTLPASSKSLKPAPSVSPSLPLVHPCCRGRNFILEYEFHISSPLLWVF